MNKLNSKFNKLKEYIKSLNCVAVAFSGGVDSTFLLAVCKNILDKNCMAITAKSSLFPERELIETIEFCKKEGIRQSVFEFDGFRIKNFEFNPKNRCYICKLELFKNIISIAKENKITNILEGSNSDDTSDYRPGLKAIRELNVLSPLKYAELTKSEIRILSEKLNLSTYNKPSLACLATRIPYGETITQEKLKMANKAEELLFGMGFYQSRVRIHNNIARIEIMPDEFYKIIEENNRVKIVTELKKIGFDYISLDLTGYRTGSMNEVINT